VLFQNGEWGGSAGGSDQRTQSTLEGAPSKLCLGGDVYSSAARR